METSLTLKQVAGIMNKCYLNGYNARCLHTDGHLTEQPEWQTFLRRTLHLNFQYNTKSRQS